MPNLSKLTVLSAFDLPMKAAIAFLTQKVSRVTWDWNELSAAAQSKAFTVAKVLQADVLESIRSALEEAQERGLPFEAFKLSLEPTLKAKGWWGRQSVVNPKTGVAEAVQLGSPWRLETIYRTNLQAAFQAGRYKQQQATARRRPYLQYHAITDIRTTSVCRALHLKVFPVDDPIWARAYPPNHFNCRARVVSLSGRELQRLGLAPESGSAFENWKPEEGFAGSPAAGWEPDVKKYPKEIGEQLSLALRG